MTALRARRYESGSGRWKPLSGPAEGRPQGPGLDNGVSRRPPGTLELEPRQGLVEAKVVSQGAGERTHPARRRGAGTDLCSERSAYESSREPMCSAALRSSLESTSV